MKYVYFSILFIFYNTQSFCANECSGDVGYKTLCAHMKIYPSYVCTIENKDSIGSTCYNKAFKLLNKCETSVLLSCDTEENDAGDKYERCVLRGTKNDSCKAFVAQYID